MKRFAALLALPLLGACGFDMGIRPSLEGSRWQVTRINGEALPPSAAYQVEFRGGRLGGTIGCNHFSGPYRLGAEAIFVGTVAATRKLCTGPGMDHENAGFAAMRLPLRIFWTDLGTRLVLTSSAGSLDLKKLR